MKGPGFRYDLDIRRVWECPKCGQRLRYLGHVTSHRCRCDGEGVWMRIVNENARRTFPTREKIVIPDDVPEEIPLEETPVEEPVAGDDSPAPEAARADILPEIIQPPVEPETSPPPAEELPHQSAESPQSAPHDYNGEQPTGRKKRRRKRRRKKSRGKPPEASGDQQTPPGPADSNPNTNSPSDPGKDDFGKNVF